MYYAPYIYCNECLSVCRDNVKHQKLLEDYFEGDKYGYDISQLQLLGSKAVFENWK